jgi:chain length determinant protein (polysaccharide antigen chain regulator)
MQDKSSLTVVASNMNIPRYMRGTKVLSAELEALKNRQSDDAFIKGLRDWQQEVRRLKLIDYQPEGFQPYILDGHINKPQSPIKPKRSLVLALSIVLGLFLGVFAAFFSEFIQKARQKAQ